MTLSQIFQKLPQFQKAQGLENENSPLYQVQKTMICSSVVLVQLQGQRHLCRHPLLNTRMQRQDKEYVASCLQRCQLCCECKNKI